MKFRLVIKTFFILQTLILTACFESLMSTSHGNGPSTSHSFRTPDPTSESIYIPLNFSLRPEQNIDFKEKLGKVTENDVKKFISIGSRALSNSYSIDGNSWKIKVIKNLDPEPYIDHFSSDNFVNNLLGNELETTYLDYKLDVEFNSLASMTLNQKACSKIQHKLLIIDTNLSKKRDYRVSFSGNISIELRKGTNTIYFDGYMYVKIKRKSTFSSDEHFLHFKSIDSQKLIEFKKSIQEFILKTYVNTLNSYDLSVQGVSK